MGKCQAFLCNRVRSDLGASFPQGPSPYGKIANGRQNPNTCAANGIRNQPKSTIGDANVDAVSDKEQGNLSLL
jgi:hypothetical protein